MKLNAVTRAARGAALMAAWLVATPLVGVEDYVLEIGKEQSIPARAINHGLTPLKGILVAATSDSPWLAVKLSGGFPGGSALPEIKEGATFETSISLSWARSGSRAKKVVAVIHSR
jgi:hypothetical protein